MDAICNILSSNKQLLRIPIRQKAKFEGWLKFELAGYLELKGYQGVRVERQNNSGLTRSDVTFLDHNLTTYNVELKTSNTNWKLAGVQSKGKPITKNINSIVKDCLKMNSLHGIIAFLMFPIGRNDNRWEIYLQRIARETGIRLHLETNCRIVEMEIDDINTCDVMVCTFISGTEPTKHPLDYEYP